MSDTSYNEETNTVIFNIKDAGGYSAFKMYNDSGDPRQLNRHEETVELKNVIANNTKHAQIVVQYGETYIPLKNR